MTIMTAYRAVHGYGAVKPLMAIGQLATVEWHGKVSAGHAAMWV